MKLRNRKTGEIGWLYCDHISIPKKMTVFSEDKDLPAKHWDYDSLTELNSEWEDYKEGYYWYIDDMGMPSICSKLHGKTAKRKAFGNYFETKEEAVKATEKLKAWKRLKDQGFKFKAWSIPETPETSHITLKIWAETEAPYLPYDLGLLFGGEE